MIVHAPEMRSENGEVCVSARVELQTRGVNIPEVLWFKFPESYDEFVTDRADAFAVSSLLLAMTLGEDMEVRGVLSPRLVSGMQEYQRIFNLWFPQRFKLIDIRCNNYERQHEDDVKGGVACAFSGGVDSFYTLWSHPPQNERNLDYQVSYALFVHGFDIALEDEATYSTARHAYEETMQMLGLQLLTARTNVRQLLACVDWGLAHGSALIGLALALGLLLSRFYVPATHTYSDLVPWGSDPRLDPLLSTETLQVVHDGASVTRVEKTAVIAQWAETYSRLRVCWVKPDGLSNCCRCEKCIRTMIALDMVGTLPQYTTFPLPMERQNIRSCRFLNESERAFAREIIDRAIAVGRKDIAFDVRYALFRSRVLLPTDQIKRNIAAACRRLLRKAKETR